MIDSCHLLMFANNLLNQYLLFLCLIVRGDICDNRKLFRLWTILNFHELFAIVEADSLLFLCFKAICEIRSSRLEIDCNRNRRLVLGF
jgi:hypothetical protein